LDGELRNGSERTIQLSLPPTANLRQQGLVSELIDGNTPLSVLVHIATSFSE